jgi:hypothetical protein
MQFFLILAQMRWELSRHCQKIAAEHNNSRTDGTENTASQTVPPYLSSSAPSLK